MQKHVHKKSINAAIEAAAALAEKAAALAREVGRKIPIPNPNPNPNPNPDPDPNPGPGPNPNPNPHQVGRKIRRGSSLDQADTAHRTSNRRRSSAATAAVAVVEAVTRVLSSGSKDAQVTRAST